MDQQKLELRKIRGFGDNISDTFSFIRGNFRRLLQMFFSVCGIFLLIMAVCSGLQARSSTDLIAKMRTMEIFGPVYSGPLFKDIFFVIVPTWLGITAVGVMVNAYMLCYDAGPGIPSIDGVWKHFRKFYLKVLLYSIPVGLLIGAGSLICVLPGIYLGVVLTNYISIAVMEDASLGVTFNRCFTLIRGNFWLSLGIYLIVYLIAFMASLTIGIIFGVAGGIWMLVSVHSYNTLPWIFLVIINVFRLIFYIIPTVSITLHYFTLTERVDGLGLIRKVGQIGVPLEGMPGEPDEEFGH
ncbi:MAG TPA: hypothetical protein VNE41_08020 [Chitinophagaceae bacterium]|nr:hypothetical protein [Chitinophagaceae bacterium]